MSYARKTDNNHAQIRDALRSIPGFVVADTSRVGGGFPDLVVGGFHQRSERHIIVLVEIKDTGKEKNLTEKERAFWEEWKSFDYIIISSLTEVLTHGFGWAFEDARQFE